LKVSAHALVPESDAASGFLQAASPDANCSNLVLRLRFRFCRIARSFRCQVSTGNRGGSKFGCGCGGGGAQVGREIGDGEVRSCPTPEMDWHVRGADGVSDGFIIE
jgi:hypothetical protein